MKKLSIKHIRGSLHRYYIFTMMFVILLFCMSVPAFAATTTTAPTSSAGGKDIWSVANTIIVDVYTGIAGVSTVLAGLMSAVAVIGAKLSNNQHKTDQAWDWLKRIWVAWAIINGIGAFIAYIVPLFSGLNTLNP